MFIKRPEAEKKIIEYLNERDQQAGEPERQVLNPAIAKLICDDVQNIRAIQVRPKGKWIVSEQNIHELYCSECKGIHNDKTGIWRETFTYKYAFCPLCGVDMRGE